MFESRSQGHERRKQTTKNIIRRGPTDLNQIPLLIACDIATRYKRLRAAGKHMAKCVGSQSASQAVSHSVNYPPMRFMNQAHECHGSFFATSF